MDPTLLGRLPAEIRRLAEELVQTEHLLLGAISADPGENLEILAQQRDRQIVTLCEALERLGETELRYEALLAMTEANTRIASAAAAALDANMADSARGALQRRAISAYGAVDTGTE